MTFLCHINARSSAVSEDKGLKRLLRRLYFAPPINRLAARWHARVRPPPWRRPRMEFDYDVWNGISSLHGRAGRQIGENNSGPDLYREVLRTEHRVRNFEGSRRGLPVNATALKNAMPLWRDTLQFAMLLRQRFIDIRHLPEGSRFDLRQGYLYSKMAAALVAFQVRRRHHPLPDRALPELETAFFTLGVGPFMVVRSLFENGDRAALTPGALDADDMYRLADESGSLVTPAGKGCAGSRKLITEFLDVVMNGRDVGPLDCADAQRAIVAIGDWQAFERYLLASSRLELYVKVGRALGARLLLQAGAAGRFRVGEMAWVEAALGESYERTPRARHTDDALVLGNGLDAMLALLEDQGDATLRGQLEEEGLLESDPRATRRQIAASLRALARLLATRSQAELDTLAAALQRPAGARVEANDFLVRCGGQTLARLLESLDTRDKTDSGVRVRPFDLALDLSELQRWLHMDYARFWGLADASAEKIARLFSQQLEREGYRTLIGEDASSGERRFLLEIYDPRKDELARHYAARRGDLGYHILLAPAQRAQPGFTPRMLRAVHEVLFADPAVRRIVAEPDVRNLAIYRRLLQLGYRLGPVVQLPGKTSRLVFLDRHRYREDEPVPGAERAPLHWHRVLGAAHIFRRRVTYKLGRFMGRTG